MSTFSSKNILREWRIKAGISQEQLCEGICSPRHYARIESGEVVPSSLLFSSLMSKLGAIVKVIPEFSDWDDYDIYMSTEHSLMHLDAWQFQRAYDSLSFIAEKNWHKNKMYYQRWLYLYCFLLVRSGSSDPKQICNMLLVALHTTKPGFKASDHRKQLFTSTELDILLLYAQEKAVYSDDEEALTICTHLENYIANSPYPDAEKNKLLAREAVALSNYLLSTKEYSTIIEITTKASQQAVFDANDSPLLELNFAKAKALYLSGKTDEGLDLFKDCYYLACALSCQFAATIRNYVIKELRLGNVDDFLTGPDIPVVTYPVRKLPDSSHFTDGSFTFDSFTSITVGAIIKRQRQKRKLSLGDVAEGLCGSSTLSKIENNQLTASVSLLQALLQRVGISDQSFEFYGTKDESRFEEIHHMLRHKSLLSSTETEQLLSELKNLTEIDRTTLSQYIYLQDFLSENTHNIDWIEGFVHSLELSHGKRYDNALPKAMSRNDLSTVSLLLREFNTKKDFAKAEKLFLKLKEYCTCADLDEMLVMEFMPITYSRYAKTLMFDERYDELDALAAQVVLPYMTYFLLAYRYFLFYRIQELGNQSRYSEMSLLFKYHHAMSHFLEPDKSNDILRDFIKDEYGMIFS